MKPDELKHTAETADTKEQTYECAHEREIRQLREKLAEAKVAHIEFEEKRKSFLKIRDGLHQERDELRREMRDLEIRLAESERLLAQEKHAFHMLRHESVEATRVHNQEMNGLSEQLSEAREFHARANGVLKKELAEAREELRTGKEALGAPQDQYLVSAVQGLTLEWMIEQRSYRRALKSLAAIDQYSLADVQSLAVKVIGIATEALKESK